MSSTDVVGMEGEMRQVGLDDTSSLWASGSVTGSLWTSGGSSLQVPYVGEGRQQAGPLPSKRGEIGYQENAFAPPPLSPSQLDQILSPLPARHPADRDETTPAPDSSVPLTTDPIQPSPTAAQNDAASQHSQSRSLLKYKRLPKIGGIRLGMILLFVLQFLAIVGTITGWALIAKFMPQIASQPNANGLNATTIFIHVTFGIAVLMQVVFLERTVFRLRAERFAFKHPGGILPTASGNQGFGSLALGIAPWNRPPLPTYAAALAQSGVGTGDVEDHVIAVPPPPAYGQTRGSTLLLSGLINNSMRRQRDGQRQSGSSSTRSSWMSERSERSRPVSYKSTDSAWEEALNAHRSLQLESTLAQLEEGGGRASRADRREVR